VTDRNLDRAYKSYVEAIEHVTTQKKNVELAAENYRIVERRYHNDLSLLTDMLDASTAKLDAETRLVNAQVDVLYYYFQLKYLSGII
jgi:outer membrane protein TolC